MTSDSFVCVRTKNSFLEATSVEGFYLGYPTTGLSKSSSEGRFAVSSRYTWAIGCAKPAPDRTEENVDSDIGLARQKRLLPGKAAREAYRDAANRRFEVEAMDDYREEQILERTDSLSSLLQDPSGNQYLHTILLLKRRQLSVTWSLIWSRVSAGTPALVGLYYAWDTTLDVDAAASPRSVIVDFMLLPTYRTPDVYAQIGRWIFVQLFGERSRKLYSDIFRRHGERCLHNCIIPLSTNVTESACEREVLRRFGFKDLPECDSEISFLPQMSEWKARLGLSSESQNALVETYFDRMAYRSLMSIGPFLWKEMESMASHMVQADRFDQFMRKRPMNELIPTRKLRRLSCAASALRVSWRPGNGTPIYWNAGSGVCLRVCISRIDVATMLEKVEALRSEEDLEGVKVVVVGSCSTGVTSTDGVYHCQHVGVDESTSSGSMLLGCDCSDVAELRFFLNLIPKRELNEWLPLLTNPEQELFLTVKVSCYAHLPRKTFVPIFIAKQTLEPEWRLGC